jgi:two-component system chemotaxis response regulator CheY
LRILIAEDDLTSRKFLLKYFSKYGEVDVVIDGLEALDAYALSMKDKRPYNLICLDVMMPKVDGIKVLKAIRDYEKQHKILAENKAKIIMITALADTQYVNDAFGMGCEAYIPKPVDLKNLKTVMTKLNILVKEN